MRTKEDGSVVTERRDKNGAFIAIHVNDEESNPEPFEGMSTEQNEGKLPTSFPTISNRRRKKVERIRRQGFVIDLEPDLQCANVAPGVYLGPHNVFSISYSHT